MPSHGTAMPLRARRALLALGLTLVTAIAACGGGGSHGGGSPQHQTGLAMGTVAAAPLQAVTIGGASDLSGAGLKDVGVRFFNASGYSVTITPSSLHPLRVEAPFYVDPATGVPGAADVSAAVVLADGSALPVSGKVSLEELPALPTLATGELTAAYLSSLRTALLQAKAGLASVSTTPAALSQRLDGDTDATVDALDEVLAKIAQQRARPGSLVAMGSAQTATSAALPFGVDDASLRLTDRMISAFIRAYSAPTASGGSTSSPATARVTAAVSGDDDLDTVTSGEFWRQFLVDIRNDTLEAADKVQRMGRGLEVLAGALAFVDPPAAVAVGALGAAAMVAPAVVAGAQALVYRYAEFDFTARVQGASQAVRDLVDDGIQIVGERILDHTLEALDIPRAVFDAGSQAVDAIVHAAPDWVNNAASIAADIVQSGTVTPTPSLAATLDLSADDLDFGPEFVGDSTDSSFAVTNSGAATIAATASAFGPFAIVSGSSLSLAPGSSGTVTVRFTPQGVGAQTGGATIAAASGTKDVWLHGVGDAPTIAIAAPADGSSTTSRVTTVSGSVHGAVPQVTITVGAHQTSASVSGGTFSTSVVLEPGANTIVVSASTAAGPISDSVSVTSTAPPVTIQATLTWSTGGTDVDLYVIEPSPGTAVYYSQRSSPLGSFLDVDNTSGFGPEEYALSAAHGDNVAPGAYKVRVHYYSGHTSPPTPPPATAWTVTVVVNQGTPQEARRVFTGTLSADSAANASPTGTGADWADVVTVSVAGGVATVP